MLSSVEHIPQGRPRFAITAGVTVPLLFLLFGAWGFMMAIPALRALAYGLPLTDQIAVLDHGKHVLRPVWHAALPGLALGMAGLSGAAWAFWQYRLPEYELPPHS